MATQRDTSRPFRDDNAHEILDAGRKAYRRQDERVLLAAIAELDEFRNTREAERVREELNELLERLAPRTQRRHRKIQYCHECSRQFHGADAFYCESCGPKLRARLERDVGQLRSMAADGVYVGRTAFPERRLLEHLRKDHRDRLSILHWAASLEEAEAFERQIHDFVKDLSRQEQPRAGGRFSRCHHAIYLSWTPSSTFPAGQLFHHALVTELLGARQWPAPPSRFEAVHLWCPISPEDADDLLDDLDEREREYLDERRARG
ncbi:MAG TPA: GIY-YIG nuclease family protein [Polyangiaceae bacterium]|nr:GIY-YIG nuclease family protein [Polyangiaceae bacterium]